MPTRLERWELPDGDFLDIHHLDAPPTQPRLLILHGLEGSANSHYARGLLLQAAWRGWAADVLVFRSCGKEPNRLPRSYHSGETTDLNALVSRLVAAEPDRPLLLTGVSLGGNVVLKWLGEHGAGLPLELRAAATVSVPYDLARSARQIDQGFARVYQASFLRTLRHKARAKNRRFPGLISAEGLHRARSLFDFDEYVTAPVHGFQDAADYYSRSSSLQFLSRIRLPTLLLSAIDDPFLPHDVLEVVRLVARDNPYLELEFPAHGGHVGFVAGAFPWKAHYYAEWRVTEFLASRMASPINED